MEKEYTVYLHRNPVNNKVYVGITSQGVEKRWKKGQGYTKCNIFYRVILKYGWDNLEYIIVCKTCKERALLLERCLVKHYKRIGLSYNITDGGEECPPSMLGKHHTLEAKLKISLAGRRPCKEQTKIKIGEANKGPKNGMYGKHLSPCAISNLIKVHSKPVLQLDKDNNIINRFSSASEAEKCLGGKGSHISCCCLGKRKTAYGFKWKYE